MQFIIQGGRKLKGSIRVNGSKNAGLPLLSAALLTGRNVTLNNIPDIADIQSSIKLMQNLGARVEFDNHTVKIKNGQLSSSVLNEEIAKKMRASIFFTVPVLARLKSVTFPHPGGCVIGERPIDIFTEGYRAFGAIVAHTQKSYTVTADQLRGTRFVFPIVSVAATENLMMIATVAQGDSTLINAAMEPEIIALADFLNSSGAHIEGAGTSVITIRGGTHYESDPDAFQNIPDRLEAGSLIILGVAANAELEITDLDPRHLDVLLLYLKKMDAQLEIGTSSVRTLMHDDLTVINIKTHEYPGFPTDLQSPMVVLMTQAQGQGIVHETIFEGRMAWAEDLKRMGANILPLDNFRIAITGPTPLHGRMADSLDIRAGMAYLIAGLIANGTSTINDIEKIDRGYERLEERLRAVGADIKRI